MKKKLVGGLKLTDYLFCFLFFFFSNTISATQIYDYHTENFINKLISKISSVNTYNKKILFKIVKDDFPNAFVTKNDTIYLSSALLTNSPDYVSVLAVLAHEIGHLEKYHVKKRINQINSLKNINSYGNIAAIFGSMIIQEPELINAIIVNQSAVSNMFINFSQEQEIEADIYAVETLNKLNLSTNSIKNFLLMLEDISNFNMIDQELRKFSTHPIFSERYKIIEDHKINSDHDFNMDLQNEFNFIKVKFMAYTNTGNIKEISDDYKIYFEAIQLAKSGKLIEGLKKINLLITKYKKYFFLQETKADILLSYGYYKEAIAFYENILINQSKNNYARFNYFINKDFNKNENENEKIFIDNQILIYNFPSNDLILRKYNRLAKILNYPEWMKLFEIILFDKKNLKTKLNQLKNQTKDNNLKKIIKMYM